MAGGCAGHSTPAPVAAGVAPPAATPAVDSIPLPGAPATGGVVMDYLAYDRERHRVWVPAGNTGSVDVIDTEHDTVVRIDGFATAEMERKGTKRTVGPSSATVGQGTVYVGNRGDQTVCALDAATLRREGCVKVPSMPDGLAYVAATKEVWVTTPRDQSINVIDVAIAGRPKLHGQIKFDGEPEGFAVDEARGIFYTNLEDKDRTLAIELKTRKVIATWLPKCGEDGPKGLALANEGNFLFVACANGALVLDAGHQGAELARVPTGDGVDNIFYVEGRRALYVAAARAATMTIAQVDAHGGLSVSATVPTSPGARNAVVTDDGIAYLTDSRASRILVVRPR